MGASLRHCVAFKREKIMMHNLDSVFALKPLISLTFTRTQGHRNVSNFGGDSQKEPYWMGLSFEGGKYGRGKLATLVKGFRHPWTTCWS